MAKAKFKGMFTQHEVEIAIRVLMESQLVVNWVTNELKAYGVDTTKVDVRSHSLYLSKAREYAQKLIL